MLQQANGIFSISLPTPFPVGRVNVYLMKGDVLTLVDTGPKTVEAWQSFKSQLNAIGFQPSDIEQVILTHHHVDHIGLLDFLKLESPSLQIAGHNKNDPWLRQDKVFIDRRKAFFRNCYQEMGVSRDQINRIERVQMEMLKYSCLVDGLTYPLTNDCDIPGHPGWKVVETPGHAQSHIVLFHERSGIVISGDHIIGHISSNALIESPYDDDDERVKPLLQYIESLEMFKEGVSTAYPGHGNPIHDTEKLIAARLHGREKKASGIKRILKEKPLTCYEVCRKYYPEIYENQGYLVISEILGHLDLLESRGEVKKSQESDGLFYYRLSNKEMV